MEGLALGLDKLASHTYVILVVLGSTSDIGKGEMSQLMGCKHLQACLGPFVETFKKRYSECVSEA